MSVWVFIVALAAGVLAILLLPFLRKQAARSVDGQNFDVAVYRDQLAEVDRDLERGHITAEQSDSVRLEIQRRLLAAHGRSGAATTTPVSRNPVVVILICLIPLLSGALYLHLGAPETPGFPHAERNDPVVTAGAGGDMKDMIAGLEARLAANPDNPQGWAMLGRTYLVLEQYDRSAAAFNRLFELTGDIRAKSEYAEARIMANGAIVSGQMMLVLDEIIQAAPLDPKARFYSGVGTAQNGNLVGAVQIWTDLVHLSPPGAEWLPVVHRQIDDAAATAGIDPADVTPSPEAIELAVRAGSDRLPVASGSPPPGPTAEDIEDAASMSEDEQLEMIRSMVQRLADRLEETPTDPQGWQRLIRAYEVLGESEKADQARRDAAPYLP